MSKTTYTTDKTERGKFFRMSNAEGEKLKRLADESGLTETAVLRKLINRAKKV